MKEERFKKLTWVMQEVIIEALWRELVDLEETFWMVTITWIKISTDLSYTDIYVSSLKNGEDLTKVLAKYAYKIQKQVVKKINIRKIPRLRFRYDNSWEISSQIIETVNNLNK